MACTLPPSHADAPHSPRHPHEQSKRHSARHANHTRLALFPLLLHYTASASNLCQACRCTTQPSHNTRLVLLLQLQRLRPRAAHGQLQGRAHGRGRCGRWEGPWERDKRAGQDGRWPHYSPITLARALHHLRPSSHPPACTPATRQPTSHLSSDPPIATLRQRCTAVTLAPPNKNHSPPRCASAAPPPRGPLQESVCGPAAAYRPPA